MPIYQTAEDQANQRAALDVLERYSGCVCKMRAPLSRTDATMRRGDRLVAEIEVKCRKNGSLDFDSLIIDVAKLDNLLSRARRNNVVPLVLATWPDAGEPWWVVPVLPYIKTITKRGDRPDKPDATYCIPIVDFRMACRVNEVLP